MEKKKKKYNFKNVLVEVEFDSFKEMNVAKVVANAVHSNTDDIGIDDKARELYHNGIIELSDEMARVFLAIILQTNLLAALKLALRKMLQPEDNNKKEK